MFYCIIVPLAWLVWHIAFRIHVVGREHLIQGRGFVLAPNHISAIDPVFVVLARFWGRRMIVLGKEELFEVNPFVTWFLRHVGVVPVHRGKGDTAVVQQAIRQVQAGQGALIFPEGTRSKDPDGKMLPPKAGIALIAKATHADVLPACIYFEGKSKFRKKITVRFGEVIPYEELGLTDESNMSEIKDASRLVMGKIGELLEKGHEKD